MPGGLHPVRHPRNAGRSRDGVPNMSLLVAENLVKIYRTGSEEVVITKDIYHDPNLNEDIEYHNFGFKGVIDPQDITYAYTLKLNNHKENPTLARQLWLNGKLKFEYISGDKIIAKGYEIEYTPECHGFIRDEIEFQLVKTNNVEEQNNSTLDRFPLLEQPAYAEEIKSENKQLAKHLDSAKDKSGFDP